MFLAKSVIEESVPERVEFLGWADLPSVVVSEKILLNDMKLS